MSKSTIRKEEMPLKIKLKTLNYGYLKKYFKGSQSAAYNVALVERQVREQMHDNLKKDIGWVFKFIGFGIMVFIILLGLMILWTQMGQAPPVQDAAPVTQTTTQLIHG